MEYNDAPYYDNIDNVSDETGEEKADISEEAGDLGEVPKDNTDNVSDETGEEKADFSEEADDLGEVPEGNTDDASDETGEEKADFSEEADDPNDLNHVPENDDEVSSEDSEDQSESDNDLNNLGDVLENEYEVSSGTKIEQQKIADSNVNEDILTYDCDDEYEDEYFNKKDWLEAQLVSVEDRINLANRNLDVLEWENENRIGDCVMKPKDANSEIAKALTEAGVEGIKYTNGNVDFSPVSKYDFEIENMEELYKKLGDSISIGKLDSRKDLSREVRSKWQSLVKDEIVSRINSDSNFAEQFEKKTGIKAPFGEFTKKMLNDGLSQNKLSLHETSDCSSVQFVPRTIHETYKHCGGTAEMMEKLLSGDHKA